MTLRERIAEVIYNAGTAGTAHWGWQYRCADAVIEDLGIKSGTHWTGRGAYKYYWMPDIKESLTAAPHSLMFWLGAEGE